MIFEAHRQQLQLKYGLPEALVRSLEESGEVCSLSPSEVRDHLGRTDIDSSGFLLKYPRNGASTIRLDIPHVNGDGKPQKYLRRKGEPNYLFNPGVDLSQAGDLWIVEGELKALCGHAQGLPIVGLSGVYNWRTSGPEAELLANGEKLKDDEALLPELAQVNWDGKKVTLLYDSDIVPGHKARDAFPRLAEQLYRLGAEEVRVLTLPPVAKEGKTGLDDFILARKEQALQDLQAIRDRAEPYLPIRAGGVAFAERLIKAQNLEDRLKATVAYLGAKGKVFALEWLKEHGIKGEIRTALLQEAKEMLAQLQAQAKPSSQAEEDTPEELGPEYNEVKELLKPIITEYCLDKKGRLCRLEEKTVFAKDGTEHILLQEVHLCNFAAWPLREILKDNGVSQDRYLELQGLLQDATPLLPRKISLAEFLEKPTWAGLAWGAKAAIRPREEKEVRYCIQRIAQGIPETIIYTHLGWRQIGNSWVYLHAGGAIGSESVEVEISDRLRRYSLPSEAGDIKEALIASLFLLKLGPKRIMISLYALVWLPPLLEPLRQAGIEPGFVTYIWGTTGSFKSTLIALFLSHYGNFSPKSLPASFRDTPKSIEEMAFQTKDTLLVVDDLYPAKNPREKERLEGVLEYLTRNQGDRQGRGRLTSNISLMVGHPPRGLALCSGETMPLSGSSLARNLVLHLLKEDINQEKLTQAQAQKDLLSQAMRGYLEWLAPQIDELPSHFAEDFERLREEARRTSKTRTRHRRLDEMVAHLFIGLNTFIHFAITHGALSQKEAADLLQEAWETLNQVADDLAQVAEREEPTKRFFEALLELQTQGRIYFATMEDATPEVAERTLGAVKIGWGPDDKGVYYLLWGPAWEQVIKYLRTQEEGISLSKNSLLDSIEQQGLLDRTQAERRVIKKKIAGEQYRVLPILEKAFNLEEGESEA
jgi:hypothetical protein